MNPGLLRKALREILLTTVILGLFLALAEGLLTFVLTARQAQFAQRIADLPMLQGFLKGLLGVETADAIGPGMLAAVAWVHPVILALAWAHAIIIATRVPAGEIERGTIDVLLGLPISRRELFVTETLACVMAGVVLMFAAAGGHALGAMALRPELRLPAGKVAIIVVNLFAVYLTVGAAAMLLSALSDRRGRAISIAFGLVVASFLVNYLSQVWAPAEHVAFLSLLRYDRPLLVMRTGEWPVRDLVSLGGAAVVLWVSAGVVLCRRDITTT
jgi:ABC-type transport system involved in multi-copper enzyme maturation permease subunit